MKIKRIIYVLCVISLTLLFLVKISSGQEKNPDVKQKITTPTLELSEEETSRKDTPNVKIPESFIKSMPGKKDKHEMIKPADNEIAFTPKAIETNTKVELILDASGSMNGLMGTATKMELLKTAVDNVMAQPLPEGAKREIGLRVYGSEKPSEDNDCEDTKLLLPIGELDKKLFKAKIDNIKALGVTPIGYSLEKATEDFKPSPDVDNVIILVTDGTDSCKANICEIAKKIHAGPEKIIIHVIGFDLDQKTSKEIECIAKNSDGQFMQARSENELRAALDQVLMANIPYNLRMRIVAGATPIPASLIVYKSGTKRVVSEDETTGVKFYQLPPGTYDIEVTYKASNENPRPTKMIKRVEVQATSKAEQTVQFDLGMLTLESFDQHNTPTSAYYVLQKMDDPRVSAKFETGPGRYTVWLTDGTYKVMVRAKSGDGLEFNATADNVKITKGTATSHDFRFQVGKIKVVAKDSKENPITLKYWITPTEKDSTKVLEGILEKDGPDIELPPGKYDLYFTLDLEDLKDLPVIKQEGVEVSPGDTLEKKIEMPTATLTLAGKNKEEKIVETEFSIWQSEWKKEKPIVLTSEDKPVSILLPPGKYNVKAVFTKSEVSPLPTVSWENMILSKGQQLEKEAVFKFGELKLYGRNVKGAPIRSAFYVYRTGEEEAVATLVGISTWADITLTEGFYDIKAVDVTARSDPKPTIWFHNVEITSEAPVQREAVFTHGKLKMACRGPNNVSLPCDYRVFTYGMDSPIFEGKTDEQWKEFDIAPGSYYIEAGYHDDADEVLLKKWISIKIAENEMLEQIIRF